MALENRKLLEIKLDEQEVDEVLWDIYDTTTNEETGEVARGWATGPHTEEGMDELQGHKYWTASRRFGTSQGEKKAAQEPHAPVQQLSSPLHPSDSRGFHTCECYLYDMESSIHAYQSCSLCKPQDHTQHPLTTSSANSNTAKAVTLHSHRMSL